MPEAGTSWYDVTIAHEGPSPSFAFTLTALSNCKVRILDGPPPLPFKAEVSEESFPAKAGDNRAPHERNALCFFRSEEPGPRPLLAVTILAIPFTAIRSTCSSLPRRFRRGRNNNGSKSLPRQTRRRQSTSGSFTQAGNESTSEFGFQSFRRRLLSAPDKCPQTQLRKPRRPSWRVDVQLRSRLMRTRWTFACVLIDPRRNTHIANADGTSPLSQPDATLSSSPPFSRITSPRSKWPSDLPSRSRSLQFPRKAPACSHAALTAPGFRVKPGASRNLCRTRGSDCVWPERRMSSESLSCVIVVPPRRRP